MTFTERSGLCPDLEGEPRLQARRESGPRGPRFISRAPGALEIPHCEGTTLGVPEVAASGGHFRGFRGPGVGVLTRARKRALKQGHYCPFSGLKRALSGPSNGSL